MKDELRNVISGKSEVRNGTAIQATACYLKNSQRTSEVAKNSKLYKKQEEEVLRIYISEHNLWLTDIDASQYVSEGAEQKVYLEDGKHVIKLNDSIYYSTWEDYFYNLLLHNYFFPDTAYELIGFTEIDSVLYAIVEQSFVRANAPTDLQKVKDFLTENGFSNTKNHDYYNSELGIILEDLHDENVLTNNETLYFIDTVFFLTDKFYKD